MLLRNKRTGQLGNFIINKDHFECVDLDYVPEYRNLAELNEEWEDASEEPKTFWAISWAGEPEEYDAKKTPQELKDMAKEIDNYFETREEAEKAVEKLKAWKRLKDTGFRFTDDLVYGEYYGCGSIRFIISPPKKDVIDDLNLLFGGEA